MKLIVFKGKDNIGKTTSIRHVFETLIDKGAEVKKYDAQGRWYDDFLAILEYHGKKIVICSLGDLIGAVRNGRELAIENDADILIVAWTNRLENRYDFTEEFPNDKYEITIIEQDKLVPVNFELRNQFNNFSNKFIEDYLG